MISSKIIKNAIYDLCVEANTTLNADVVKKIWCAYNSETNIDAKQALQLILINAKMAQEKKMPLCQDTGQVLVFIKIGNRCQVENLNDSINKGIEKAYEENFYRKSIVKNALFNRTNTKTNTPCIIYTEIIEGNELDIKLFIKGAGSENVSTVEMLSPTTSEDEIAEFVTAVIKKAGAKGCPPYFIGVGIGGTIEYAGLLSKKALFLEQDIDENHKNLAEKIKNRTNQLNIGAAGLGGPSTALDVKILTDFTHIACMPVAVTINCHSFRHAKVTIREQGEGERQKKIESKFNLFPLSSLPFPENNYLNVHTSNIEQLKSLNQGQNVFLSGEIYTARDMAHKRLAEMLEKGEKLPFNLKDKIIFYAGPCPCSSEFNECIVGSIGPTTSSRMDKFAPILYNNGVLATIGKGERSEEVKNVIKQVGGLYFTIIGGIACYLSEKFVKKELIAFEDLGTEAIYRFEVRDLPLRVEFN